MVNTREIAAEYRLSHWAQIMQERANSGLNIKAFCKQIGICQNTYFYWQRRLRIAACETFPVLDQKAKAEPMSDEKSLIPSGWALCEPAKPETSAGTEQTIPIEIGACRVMVGADTNPELLSKVCKVLMAL